MLQGGEKKHTSRARLPIALPHAKSLHSTSAYRSYTDGRIWLNLVMNACLSQSTTISDARTVNTGYGEGQQHPSLDYADTYIGYGPQNVVTAEPPEALRQHKALREVELSAAQLDKIPECDHHKHESQGEALDDVGACDLEEVVLLELLESGPLNLDELIRQEQR